MAATIRNRSVQFSGNAAAIAAHFANRQRLPCDVVQLDIENVSAFSDIPREPRLTEYKSSLADSARHGHQLD